MADDHRGEILARGIVIEGQATSYQLYKVQNEKRVEKTTAAYTRRILKIINGQQMLAVVF